MRVGKKNRSNERIIIHDSGGFEGGEEENFRKAIDFIGSKKKEQKLSEQLHCIWSVILVSILKNHEINISFFLLGIASPAKMTNEGFNSAIKSSSEISRASLDLFL